MDKEEWWAVVSNDKPLALFRHLEDAFDTALRIFIPSVGGAIRIKPIYVDGNLFKFNLEELKVTDRTC